MWAEGEVTEPAYLRCMASETVRLDMGRNGGSVPMSLVGRARKEAKANRRAREDAFDEIWCVFDRDEHFNVEQAIREARDSGVFTAFSNPCFELWLLLHVEPCNAHIERGAAQARCAKAGLTDGKALAEGAGARLAAGYSEARRRAEELDRMHEEAGAPPRSNPSSNVWRLVERLRGRS